MIAHPKMKTLETLTIKVNYRCTVCGNIDKNTFLVFEYPNYLEFLCTKCETRYKAELKCKKKKINGKIISSSDTKSNKCGRD